MRSRIFAALGLPLFAALACRPTPQGVSPGPCLFNSTPSPAIAWQPGRNESWQAHTTLHGRVVAVESGKPLANAIVRLEPGGHRAQSDSSGTFHLLNLQRGRYALRVLGVGRPPVQDSVTIGENGLLVLVALTQPEADLQPCLRIAPRPPAT